MTISMAIGKTTLINQQRKTDYKINIMARKEQKRRMRPCDASLRALIKEFLIVYYYYIYIFFTQIAVSRLLTLSRSRFDTFKNFF